MKTPLAHRSGRALATLVVIGLAAACSAGSESEAADLAAPESVATLDQGGGDATMSQLSRSSAPTAKSVESVPVQPSAQALIKAGRVRIVSAEVGATADRVRQVISKADGEIADEVSWSDDEGTLEEVTLRARIPVSEFEDTMADLSDLPGLREASSKVDDVTRQVIDTESRLKTLRISLKRLRGFLNQAGDLRELVGFEQRLTEVETEIAQLTRQRDVLADQVARSTLKISISRTAPPEPEPPSRDGFGAGLERGLDAVVDLAKTAATATGIALPFLLLAAVAAVPLGLLRRRRRQRKVVHEVSESS